MIARSCLTGSGIARSLDPRKSAQYGRFSILGQSIDRIDQLLQVKAGAFHSSRHSKDR